MAAQFEAKYRVKNGDEITADFFNKRLRDLDARLAEIEASLANLDATKDKLIELGLEALATAIANEIEGLQELINGAQIDVTEAQAQLTALEGQLDDLEDAIEDIIQGGILPATAITVAAIPNLAAENVQSALAEIQGDLNAGAALIAGLGVNLVVPNVGARNGLTGLVKGNTVLVENDGAGTWVLYEITAAGNGTWAGATKLVIWAQAPALSGDLDASGHDVKFDDATGIRDDSDNEQVIFRKTASAVNHVEITNAATGDDPFITAAGDDADINLRLAGKGAGWIGASNLWVDGAFEVYGRLFARTLGPEGGEIWLEKPPSGSSLAGNIAIDAWNNQLRMFENAGGFRGVYVDLSQQAGGAQSRILTENSPIVTDDYVDIKENAAPGNPAADNARLWAFDGGGAFGTNLGYLRSDGSSVLLRWASQAEMEAASAVGVWVAPGVQHLHPGHPRRGATSMAPARRRSAAAITGWGRSRTTGPGATRSPSIPRLPIPTTGARRGEDEIGMTETTPERRASVARRLFRALVAPTISTFRWGRAPSCRCRCPWPTLDAREFDLVGLGATRASGDQLERRRRRSMRVLGSSLGVELQLDRSARLLQPGTHGLDSLDLPAADGIAFPQP